MSTRARRRVPGPALTPDEVTRLLALRRGKLTVPSKKRVEAARRQPKHRNRTTY